MERRRALATAAATSFTLIAAATGLTFGSSIVSASPDDRVGQLSPAAATVQTSATAPTSDPTMPATSDATPTDPVSDHETTAEETHDGEVTESTEEPAETIESQENDTQDHDLLESTERTTYEGAEDDD